MKKLLAAEAITHGPLPRDNPNFAIFAAPEQVHVVACTCACAPTHAHAHCACTLRMHMHVARAHCACTWACTCACTCACSHAHAHVPEQDEAELRVGDVVRVKGTIKGSGAGSLFAYNEARSPVQMELDPETRFWSSPAARA